MNYDNLTDYSVSDTHLVKFTRMNNISKIVSLSHKNSRCTIQKLNKDEYLYLNTGEVVTCKHTENRGDNLNSIRYSVSQLRDLINNNFVGGQNELWITLTFGKNKIYKPGDLCPLFEKFIKRLRYKLSDNKIDYIYIPEPHEKGDWHIHLLLKGSNPLFIKNRVLNEIWTFGYVKVNRLKDIDNIGAYVSAYLINIKEGEATKKGARLYLYPPNHKLYRFSRGIKKPVSQYISYEQALENLINDKLTYSQTLKIQTDAGFENIIHYEYYKK